MAVTVSIRIPSVLRNLTGGKEMVPVQATTIMGAIDALDAAHSGIRAKIVGADGKILRYVNLFVGEEDIRFLDGPATALKDGDLVDLVPAIAGG